MPEDLRVAIAHDFAETYGGAERVTQEMAAAFPEAPVYAFTGRAEVARLMGIEDRFHSIVPARRRLIDHYRLLTPLYPLLADRARLPAADVVLSSSYAFAHRLGTENDAPRVCYCHSPLRFAWTMTERYQQAWAPDRLRGAAFELVAAAMRRSDRRAAAAVDRYLTQGPYTADQIERFYGRDAEVIGAPVDCDLFHPSDDPPEDYFLLCGRLIEPYSRFSVVIEAFRDLPYRLVIVGVGPAGPELRAMAPGNVEFLGRVSDAELVRLMQRCLAGLSPTLHDFGLIPLEVMACGRPVIAYRGGGALTTVAEGVSGEFFDRQEPDAVAQAIGAFDPGRYDSRAVRRHAERWDRAAFRARLVEIVREAASARPAVAAPGAEAGR